MNLIYYLLEANLYLVIFYLLYVTLLRSETLHQLNRAYLLITSLIAFVIPLMQIGILKPELKPIISAGTISVDQDLTTVTIIPTNIVEVHKWTLADYALTIYVAIAVGLLALLIFKIIRLVILSKKGIITRKNGFVVVEIADENVAFSFFGYLFINTQLSTSQTILNHEQVHIRQKHSWDIIYFELVKIISWFNPAVYLLQKCLKEVHEFIADEQVASIENNAAGYADFLISNAYGVSNSQLTNSFYNKNLLKRRIIMLYQKKSGKAARLKYLLTLPLMGGLLCMSTLAFTTKNYGWVDVAPKSPLSDTSQTKMDGASKDYIADWKAADNDRAQLLKGKSKLKPISIFSVKSTDSIYNTADKKPSFPGGVVAYGDFLEKNIKYPETAKNNKVQGRVFVQFVVEKDGSLSNMKLLRDPGNGLGDEAIRVLKTSPLWEPGIDKGEPVRVQYTVPVNFALPKTDNDKAIPDTAKDYGTPNSDIINATFPGGEEGYSKFLSANIHYPKTAKDNNVSGRVFVQFNVETDGTLTDLTVMREPGSGLGDEAIRVLKLSPKWIPATKDGKKVRTVYRTLVTFKPRIDDGPKDVNALYKYIRDHVRYPKDAKDKDIHGRTFVQFSLNADKQITDIKVLRTPDPLLGAEVTRVLGQFGMLTNGNTEKIYMICINFNIDHGNIKNPDAGKTNDVKPLNTDAKQNIANAKNVMLDEVVVTTYGKVNK